VGDLLPNEGAPTRLSDGFGASEREGRKITVFYADSSRSLGQSLLPGGSGSWAKFSIYLSFPDSSSALPF
jgi:hypothetical protein